MKFLLPMGLFFRFISLSIFHIIFAATCAMKNDNGSAAAFGSHHSVDKERVAAATEEKKTPFALTTKSLSQVELNIKIKWHLYVFAATAADQQQQQNRNVSVDFHGTQKERASLMFDGERTSIPGHYTISVNANKWLMADDFGCAHTLCDSTDGRFDGYARQHSNI